MKRWKNEYTETCTKMSWHQKTTITLPSSGREREFTFTVTFKVCKLQVVFKLSVLERKRYNTVYISSKPNNGKKNTSNQHTGYCLSTLLCDTL